MRDPFGDGNVFYRDFINGSVLVVLLNYSVERCYQ